MLMIFSNEFVSYWWGQEFLLQGYYDLFTVQILLYFKQYFSQTYTQIIISSKQQFSNLFVFAYVYMDQLFYVLATYVSS